MRAHIKNIIQVLAVVVFLLPTHFTWSNGYVILNGGDDLIDYIQRFKINMAESLSNLSPECVDNFDISLKDFKEKIASFKIQIIEADADPTDYFVWIDDKNYVSNKIVVDGKVRPAANVPLQNTIYLSRHLWPSVFNHVELLIHETLGLMGLEATDDYELTRKLQAKLLTGHCKAKSVVDLGASKPDFEHCDVKMLDHSPYDIKDVQYDSSRKVLGFLDGKTSCIHFWDASENRKLEQSDLKINFDVLNYFLDDGKLTLQKNDFEVQSLPYFLENTSLRPSPTSFKSEDKILSFNSLFNFNIIETSSNIYILDQDLEIKTQLESNNISDIKQILPMIDLDSILTTYDFLIIREDGLVEQLKLSRNENNFVENVFAEKRVVYRITPAEISFPFTFLNNRFLINSKATLMDLVNPNVSPFQIFPEGTWLMQSNQNLILQVHTPQPIDEDFKRLYDRVGDLAQEYQQITKYEYLPETDTIEAQSLGMFSAKFHKVVFDSNHSSYILVGENRLENRNNIFIFKINDQGLHSCIFQTEACRGNSSN